MDDRPLAALVFSEKAGLFDFGELDSNWLFFNARPIPGFNEDQVPAIVCEQPDKALCDDLSKKGYDSSPAINPLEQSAKGAIVTAGRSKSRNYLNIFRALGSLAEGGKLLVIGTKTDGIGSLKKHVAKYAPIQHSIAKHHCVVFSAVKQNRKMNLPTATERIGGYRTAPGVFSEDGPDTGSVILAACFDDRIKGSVADFGAGWGFLSGELVKASNNVEVIELYESDFVSVQKAKENLTSNERVEFVFHWVDLINNPPRKMFDWIIMNPPFHIGREADPDLGKAFVRAAAKSLPTRGRLLMVANRKLPYEGVLASEFRRFDILHERSGFKVIEAER